MILLHVDLVGDPPLVHLLGQKEPHGGGAAEHRGLQVHQELAVHVEVPRPHGHRHGPQPLHPRLEAHPRGPEAVAHGDLHPVQVRDPGHFVAAGEEVLPSRPGPSGCSPGSCACRWCRWRRGCARSARRAPPARERGSSSRRSSLVVKGRLARSSRERMPSGADAGLVQLLPVEGRAFVGVAHRPLEALELVLREVLGVLKGGMKVCLLKFGFLQSDVGKSGGAEAAAGRVVLRTRPQKGPAQLRVHQQGLALPLPTILPLATR